MKITPLDIRRKEFKRSMRGYSDEEVDVFLDDVADEFERLFQENAELQERIQRLEEQVAGHAQLKNALEKTLVSAQLQADQIIANARKEGELALKDAELKARQMMNDSYTETQRVQQSLIQLKHLEEDFRFKFRSLLEGHLKLLGDARIAASQVAAGAVVAVDAESLSGVASLSQEVPEYRLPAGAEAGEDVVAVASAESDGVDNGRGGPDSGPASDGALPADLETVGVVAAEDLGTLEMEVTAEDKSQEAVVLKGQGGQEAAGEPRGFFFGRRAAPSDEDFFLTNDSPREKGRDFEW